MCLLRNKDIPFNYILLSGGLFHVENDHFNLSKSKCFAHVIKGESNTQKTLSSNHSRTNSTNAEVHGPLYYLMHYSFFSLLSHAPNSEDLYASYIPHFTRVYTVC